MSYGGISYFKTPPANPPPRAMPREPGKNYELLTALDSFKGETIDLSDNPNPGYGDFDTVHWRPKDCEQLKAHLHEVLPEAEQDWWDELCDYLRDDPECYIWVSY